MSGKLENEFCVCGYAQYVPQWVCQILHGHLEGDVE
jgi:hypothetical protein